MHEEDIQVGKTYWGSDSKGQACSRTVLKVWKELRAIHKTLDGLEEEYDIRVSYKDGKGTRRTCTASRFCSFWRTDAWVAKRRNHLVKNMGKNSKYRTVIGIQKWNKETSEWEICYSVQNGEEYPSLELAKSELGLKYTYAGLESDLLTDVFDRVSFTFSPMRGSQKQIEWAVSLRKEMILKILSTVTPHYGYSPLCWPLEYAERLVFLEKRLKASWFIANKHLLG